MLLSRYRGETMRTTDDDDQRGKTTSAFHMHVSDSHRDYRYYSDLCSSSVQVPYWTTGMTGGRREVGVIVFAFVPQLWSRSMFTIDPPPPYVLDVLRSRCLSIMGYHIKHIASFLYAAVTWYVPVLLSSNRDHHICLLYTSTSPRDGLLSRMPSSA